MQGTFLLLSHKIVAAISSKSLGGANWGSQTRWMRQISEAGLHLNFSMRPKECPHGGLKVTKSSAARWGGGDYNRC